MCNVHISSGITPGNEPGSPSTRDSARQALKAQGRCRRYHRVMNLVPYRVAHPVEVMNP
jgi:hypothetical protein